MTRPARRPVESSIRRVVGRLLRASDPNHRLASFSIEDRSRFGFKRSLRIRAAFAAPGGPTQAIVARANIASRETPGEALTAFRLLRALRAGRNGRLTAPNPIGYDRTRGLVLYRELPGRPLGLLLHQPAVAVGLARSAGQAIRDLHRLRVTTSPKKTDERIRTESVFFRDDAARAMPGLAGRFASALIPLTEELIRSRAPVTHRVSLHGDLDLGNIVRQSDGRIGLIDFGSSWFDDPLSDVGNFLAQTDRAAWLRTSSPKLARALAAAFLRGYGRIVDRRRLQLYRAWWTAQILAYTLSTAPNSGRQIAPAAIERVRTLLRSAGVSPLTDPATLNPIDLRVRLLDAKNMWPFFSDRVNQLTDRRPAALGDLSVSHPRAVSRSSFLTAFRLTVYGPVGPSTVTVRGNHVHRATADIIRAVSIARGRRFETITPLAYLDRPAYLLYRAVDGRPLRDLLPTSRSFADAIADSGRALGQLHGLRVKRIRRLAWSDERRWLQLLDRRIRRRSPALTDESLAVRQLLERRLRPLWNQRSSLVHNDYQASNILINRRKVGIIDYTQSGLGPPALDVGNFLVHLRVMLHRILSARRIQRLADRFVAAYRRASSPAARQSIRRDLAVAELRAAYDILATTLINLGPHDPNRHRYVRLLRQLLRRRRHRLT